MVSSTGRRFPSALIGALLLALPAAVFAAVATPQPVEFPTADGLQLSATYSPPAPGHGVLVMLHGLDSTKGEWNGFSDAAHAQGWGTFAYDARGHGASVHGAQKSFRSFGPAGPGSIWSRMPDDLDAAVRWLNKKGIATSSISIIGASVGANVTARYAGRGVKLHAVVLMSPGLNYVEFRPDADITSIVVPTLIIVSEADRYAYASSQKLHELAPNTVLWTDVQPGHGVQMFEPNGGPSGLAARLLRWLAAP